MTRFITNAPKPSSLLLLWLAFIILSASFVFFAAVNNIQAAGHGGNGQQYLAPTERQEPRNQKDDNAIIMDEEHRRRLLERRTLSPEARATVRMAAEMALSKAKEKGHLPYENKADPFQEMMQARAQANKNSNNDNPAGDDDDDDDDATQMQEIQDLQSKIIWKDVDPLTMSSNSFAAIEALPQLSLEPQVEYLGVTVDCARHYFPIPWWKRLIVYLHKLRFNMIHLRLTDDENFVVKLDSYPQLAFSTDGAVYTPKELEGLVALAKGFGITIIPEVNLPLRAAAWSGIPGMIVGCPNFICDVAHYVPLNIYHEDFETVLQGVLGEVISIFDRPPMLHLGGFLSPHDADGCFEEAGVVGSKFGSTAQYLESFESMLSSVLKKLSYPEEQVIRMEPVESTEATGADDTAHNLLESQVGGITHHWLSLPGKKDVTVTGNQKASLVSTGVDLAVDGDVDAFGIYTNTKSILQLTQKPKGIVVGTLSLGENFWLQQNILPRLVSVAMAAAHGSNSAAPARSSFAASYKAKCQLIFTGKSHSLCELHGHPTTTSSYYLAVQMKRSKEWKRSICNRLAASTEERVFQPYMPNQNYASTMGNDIFWKNFHKLPKPHQPPASKGEFNTIQLADEVKVWKRSVEKTGIILDLANSLVKLDDMKKLIREFIAPLGFDLLQIRLSDDFAFAVKLEADAKLAQSEWDVKIPNSTDFKDLVGVAKTEWGMEVIPELSLTTNAGGWINGGFLVHCPKHYCNDGTGVPNDIREPQFLALVYAVLRELQEIFGSASFFHLGSDERVGSLKCYEEDGLKPDEDPPFGAFEKKLKKMLLMLGINPNNVIRWDNDEQLSYDDRAGGITHYRIPADPGDLPDVREAEPFFMTSDLFEGNVYSVYKETRAFVGLKPMGIMGEIRTLRASTWREQHMDLKLIAFFLGVSNNIEHKKVLSHKHFVAEAIRLCKAIKFPAHEEECEAAKKLLLAEKEKITDDDAAEDGKGPIFPVATDEFREALCQKYTRPRKTMAMKDEFMLADKASE